MFSNVIIVPKYISNIQVHGIVTMFYINLFNTFVEGFFVIKKLDIGYYSKEIMHSHTYWDWILLLILVSVNVGSFSAYTLQTVQ